MTIPALGTHPDREAAERAARRRAEEEGWSDQHDDMHEDEELAWAAVCYAAPDTIARTDTTQVENDPEGIVIFNPWPWSAECDKRGKHPRRRQLEIAGALIAAEIDRLRRAEAREKETA